MHHTVLPFSLLRYLMRSYVACSRKRCPRSSVGCGLEAFEPRVLLTAYTVDTLVDESDGTYSAEHLSLREAIALANADQGTSTISFASSLNNGTISLTLGEILISESVVITGLGADHLTINGFGGNHSRIFDIYNASATIDVAIANVTLDYGFGTGARLNGNGGVILNSENLTLDHVVVTRSKADPGYGGGIYSTEGTVTVRDSTFQNNQSLTRSSGSPNFGYGGAIYIASGSLVISGSTIDHNYCQYGGAANRGGGIYLEAGTADIINSTLAQNYSPGGGGGVYNANGSLTIRNSTVAACIGGGIYTGAGASSMLYNTIVIDNYYDLNGAAVSSLSEHNLIGAYQFAGGLTDGVNGNIVGKSGTADLSISEVLITSSTGGPMNNGGPTQTYALVAQSPAINAGSNAQAVDEHGVPLAFDQRGTGYARITAGTVDIGAFETDAVPRDDVLAIDTSLQVISAYSNGQMQSTVKGAIWPNYGTWQFYRGDFNGDGRTDLAGYLTSGAYQGRWYVALATSDPNTTFTPVPWGRWSTAVAWQDIHIGDYNGDGKDDILGHQANSSGEWYVGISDGSRFTNTYYGHWASTGWITLLSGDINGDGTDEIFGLTTGGQWWVGFTGTGRFSAIAAGYWNKDAGFHNFMLGDFNGDGAQDLLAQTAAGVWWKGVWDGVRFAAGSAGTWNASAFSHYLIGDFNGDGRDDLAGSDSSGQWWVGLSQSGVTAFQTSYWGRGNLPASASTVVADVDGDSKDDLVFVNYSSSSHSNSWNILQSSGSRFLNVPFGSYSTLAPGFLFVTSSDLDA